MSLFLLVSLIWVLSEIGLSYMKRSASASLDLDKSSLRILWLTITASVTIGIYIGSSRIGAIGYYTTEIHFAGIAFIGLGLLLRWISIFRLKKHFTVSVSIKEGHQLIQTGLYKNMRHPAYSGSLLSFLGLGLALNSWLSFLIIFLPILLAFSYRISVEETVLRKAFGNEYEDYAKRTRKLVDRCQMFITVFGRRLASAIFENPVEAGLILKSHIFSDCLDFVMAVPLVF